MKTYDVDLIGQVFQKIADGVVPTMGAKGRMALINNDLGRPFLTDDGVTVAREYLSLEGVERMIAIAMVEAAANTEKSAFDGTTLTVLLTNELYKLGKSWIDSGVHPQVAADRIANLGHDILEAIESQKLELSNDQVYALAYNVTKMAAVGYLVNEAYKVAGRDMNVGIKHERVKDSHWIEHIPGMMLDHGYFAGQMRTLCNDGDKTTFENAFLVLLSEGILTQLGTKKFFDSIPNEYIQNPFVFVLSQAFNPESLRLLTDTLVANKFKFQFIFINETNTGELFMDIAAKTNGTIQDAALGTSDYTFDDCGFASTITIEIDKTYIISVGDQTELDDRVAMYQKELREYKYSTGAVRYTEITRRVANLTSGFTMINVAVPTIAEFQPIKMKLDDAIGAVRCGLSSGVLIGGGKALYNTSHQFKEDDVKQVLRTPLEVIMNNAGLQVLYAPLEEESIGCDVRTGKYCNLVECGIIDSFASIQQAVTNAVSIASNYLRAFIVIRKD